MQRRTPLAPAATENGVALSARLAAGLVLLSSLACADEVTRILPRDVDGGAVVVVIEYPDGLEAVALDPEKPTVEGYFAGTDGNAVKVFFLVFEPTLAMLLLDAGPLTLVAEGGRMWPQTKHIYESKLEDGIQTEWSEIMKLPPSLESVRLEGEEPDACDIVPLAFDVANFNLDTKSNGIWAVPLDERTALLATASGDYYEVTPEGVVRTNIAGLPPPADLWVAPDDTRYLAATHGTYRAAPGSVDFTRIADGPSETYGLHLEGPSDPAAPLELFSVGGGGQVEHFDGMRWSTIGDPVPNTFNARIVWQGPGRAAVVRESEDSIQWIDGAKVSSSVSVGGEQIGLTFIGSIEQHGLMIGTREGAVLVQDGEAFRELGDPLNDRVLEIEEYDGSFLTAGAGGYIARFDPVFGFCSAPMTASHGFQLLPLAGGFLVVQSNLDSWDLGPNEEPRFPTVASWLFPQ